MSRRDKDAVEAYLAKLKLIRENTSVNPLETADDKKKRIEKAKKDFAYFVQTYAPHYATSKTPKFHVEFANRVKNNKRYKGWAKWGRALAKSVNTNVLIPLWLWINDDIKFMVLVGANETAARTLLDDLQAEFEANELLINDFGDQANSGSWESGNFTTRNGFSARAYGMGQSPRGLRKGAQRPDYEVFDDLETQDTEKNPKRQREIVKWILKGMLPLMDGERRRAVIAQNQFAPQMIFSIITEENSTWDVHRVDAYNEATYEPIWPEKFHRWYYKEWEEDIGSLEARAEFNNSPHVEGKMFLDEFIQWMPCPKLKDFEAIVGRWDVAFAGTKTSDFNAVRIWGLKDGKKVLIDCFVKQCKIVHALDWIADFQKRLPGDVSIQVGFEAQFWNEEIYRTISEVELRHGFTLNLVKIERSTKAKYERIIEMLPQYQNGRVYYSEHLKTHNDTKVGIAQLKGIEPGYSTKDDAPDADKYAFDYLDSFSSSRKTNSRFGHRASQSY